MPRPRTPAGAFARELAARSPKGRGRRWVYVPYDQLTDRVGPLAAAAPAELGVVLVESPAKAERRPYHKQKLALVLASQRHFALEQAARGVAVRVLVGEEGYAAPLEQAARELGPLSVMEPAERELRAELAPLVTAGLLIVEPHAGWLSTTAEFERFCGDAPPWRMDAFYRGLRRSRGILLEPDGSFAGGKLSHDAENRRPWRDGDPEPPEPPRFEPDAVTREVGELVEQRFAEHPGRLDLEALPASIEDVERAWSWALEECLEHFGPFEDAMTTRSRGLFHTRVSGLLNLHRLLPARALEDVLARALPLGSQEGFVRQVLGWREFVRHVHRATDGFRALPDDVARDAARGDAAPSHLGARAPLPPAFWGRPSGLACLDRVVADVWDEGYSHHITRLMVLANIATLLDVSPRELCDWFWAAYTDAYDWVVEPNVLAMGTFGAGPLMTTKPYVSGAAYIARMSDFCATCAFDPKRDCPLTRLYWAFLARHRERLDATARMAMPLRSLEKRAAAERRADAETFRRVSAALAEGALVEPGDTPPARRAGRK